jgi:4-amino-4-deoxy-L-arabinose transferase-like glycosyltransferase
MRLKIFHVVIFFGILFLFLNFYNESLLWDEVVFLSNAKAMIGESNYIENFRPPLLPLLIGSAWKFTGKNIFVAKLIAITFSVLSIYVFYKVCRLYFKKPLYPTIIFAFSSLMIYWSFRIYTDIPSMFFVLLSFYFFKKKNYLLSGVAAGLGFLARFTAFIFGFSVFLYLLIERRFNELRKYLIGLLILIPWLIYNLITYGNPIYDFYMDYKLSSIWTQPYTQPLTTHFINLIEIFNFLLPFLLIGCIKFFKEEKEHLILFYVIFSLIFLFATNLKLSRYFIMILPFLYIFVYKGIQLFKYKKIALFLITLSIVMPLIIIANIIERERICWPATKEAVDYISKFAGKNETVISNFWPYFGFFTNSTVYSNYADINFLIEQHKPKFLVFREEEWMPAPKITFEKEILGGEISLLVSKEKEQAQVKSLSIKKEKVIHGVCGDIIIYKIEA